MFVFVISCGSLSYRIQTQRTQHHLIGVREHQGLHRQHHYSDRRLLCWGTQAGARNKLIQLKTKQDINELMVKTIDIKADSDLL